ncbi:MAG: hypothetical protein CL471_04265 [Acidobacteria bacterium]|nr:hypothetical protein [Acidobacteriota bacterium]
MPPPTTRVPSDRGVPLMAPAVLRRAGAVIGVAALVLTTIGWLAYRQDLQHRRTLLLSEASAAVALEREFLERELRAVQSDLLFLSQQPLLQRFFDDEDGARSALEREYAGFAQSKPLYDQIRLLDLSGQEVVRINHLGDREGVEIVERHRLVSKASRYYVREAATLQPGEIFVSPLDLNVELGEIERPLTPVIRFVTPVVDRGANRRGLLVLNYAGTRLLGKLRELAAGVPGDMLLLNTQGEYLQAPEPYREWGWLLGHSASFRDDYPAVWETIRTADRPQVQLGSDLFTAQRVVLGDGVTSGSGAVLLVSRIGMGEVASLRPGAGVVLPIAGVFAAIVGLAFYWTRVTVGRRSQERRIAESEARLRILSKRLLAAQEEERRSLSRMLHDELGQEVTAIALDLKAARRHGGEAIQPALGRAIDETGKVLSSIHEVAGRIRSSVLDDLGLRDAIESYVSDYEEVTGVAVDLCLDFPVAPVPATVGENLYRILQEALRNVSTHAATDTVRVTVDSGSGQIELTVEDHGCGFDPGALPDSRRLGLLGMRERVELLGGEFDLEAATGHGTRIRIRLPLDTKATESGVTRP